MKNQHQSQRRYKSKRKQYGGTSYDDDKFKILVDITKANMKAFDPWGDDIDNEDDFYKQVADGLSKNIKTQSQDKDILNVDDIMLSHAFSDAAAEIVAEQVKDDIKDEFKFGQLEFKEFQNKLKNNLWSTESTITPQQTLKNIEDELPKILPNTLKGIFDNFDPKSLGEIRFGNYMKNANPYDLYKSSLNPTPSLTKENSILSTGNSFLSIGSSPLSTSSSSSYSTNDLTNLLLDPSINLTVNDFYKPGLNSFPYKFVKDKFDFEGAKLIIKNKIKDIREKHDKQISMFMDTYEDNVDSLKTYITNVTKDIVLLSRVYVCVLVSEVNSQTPIKSNAPQGNIENVKQNINRLKSMLLDTIPFLLKIEVDNKEV